MEDTKEKKTKKGRTFNFVNSIKGGCGKTTFSIFLAKYLYTIEQKTQDHSTTPIQSYEECLIFDMDFQGTSMESLFLGVFEGAKKDKVQFENVSGRKYLNAAIRENGEIDEYIVHNELTDEVVIDAVFADTDVKEKEKLRISPKMGYSPVVQYNIFKGGLLKFLDKFKDRKYKHFIFDMPPNSDGFSGAAMECVMNNSVGNKGALLEACEIRNEEDVVNLFYMTGIDLGQIRETIKEVNEQLKNRDKFYFDNLFIVINDNIAREHEKNMGENGNQEDGKMEGVIYSIIRNMFVSVGLKWDESMRIYLIQMQPNIRYSAYCMNGMGLNNIKGESEENIDDAINIDTYIPIVPYEKVAVFEKDYMLEPVDLTKADDNKWLKEKMLEKKPKEKK